MNNSSVIKVNLSIPSAEVCCLSLYHGSAIMVVNTLIALLGTFGNFLVCKAVLAKPRLRRCSNIPLLSLAIADLIITVICETLVVAMVGKITFLHECAPSLELGYSLLANLCCSSSLMHLVAISMDRFLAVTFPLRHGRIMKNYGLKNHAGGSVGCRFCIRHSSTALPEKNLLLSCSNVCRWLFPHVRLLLVDIAYFGQGKETKGPCGSAIIHWCQFESRTACCTNTGNCDHFVFCHLVSVDCCFFHHRKISGWKLWSSIHVD